VPSEMMGRFGPVAKIVITKLSRIQTTPNGIDKTVGRVGRMLLEGGGATVRDSSVAAQRSHSTPGKTEAKCIQRVMPEPQNTVCATPHIDRNGYGV